MWIPLWVIYPFSRHFCQGDKCDNNPRIKYTSTVRREGHNRCGCRGHGWSAGKAPGPPVSGPARPQAATPGNRGSAVARGGRPSIARRDAPMGVLGAFPALHSPFGETEKGSTARPAPPTIRAAKRWLSVLAAPIRSPERSPGIFSKRLAQDFPCTTSDGFVKTQP